MSTHYTKLIAKLRELFELDKADLDFGIYRIITQRQTEIAQFLEHDLKRNVRDILQDGQGDQREIIERELRATRKTIQDLGMDPSASPKVVELEEKLEAFKGSEHLEIQTYEHLYRFFSRYYDEGDFISQRRVSKDAKYAIPYNGEEVKLHWANADQYYIKSSENFRDYRFKLEDGRFVNFKLLEAESSRDNTKGDKRFFMLADEPITELDNGELQINFYYQGLAAGQKKVTTFDGTEKTANKAIFDELAVHIIKEKLPTEWQESVFSEATPKQTIIEKHINNYTATNSFDYFIHKDLGGFLSRELDFYIKNEVMDLDDVIALDNQKKFGEILQQVKAIRRVANLIISFLGQLENFQRKLWLKKKFVISSDYSFTLDHLPKPLLSVVAVNTAQRQEWVNLGFVAADLVITTDFLEKNPFLLVDTRFFDTDFKYDCLSHVDEIDEQCDGILINGDNFQALNLLQERYRDNIKCIYIDPPYNTDASEIMYKNGYKSSSWASFLESRLEITKPLMRKDSNICVTIDDFEQARLRLLLDTHFGKLQHQATVAIRSKPQGRPTASGFSVNHEYALFYGKSTESKIGRLPREGSKEERYPEIDGKGVYAWSNLRKSGGDSYREDRPKSYYPLYIKNGQIRVPSGTWDSQKREWTYFDPNHQDEDVMYPIDESGQERVWSIGIDRASDDIEDLEVREDDGKKQIFRKYRPNQSGALPGTWWSNAKYSATESGTKVLQALFGKGKSFSFPKSVYATQDCLRSLNLTPSSTCIDYFAGSGTTGHAVINLNREDQGHRKYILVEQGEYFNTVLKPRVKKVAFSEHWKDGKPVTHKDNEGSENPLNGVSHCFKTLTLESYEDTQNNLVLNRTGEQQALLDAEPAFKQDYTLNYMLDIETKGSLLNIEAFEQPFSYQMHIATDSAGETRLQNIDLIETFNYLIGLTVHTLEKLTVSIPFSKDDDGIWQAPNTIKRCEEGTADSYTFLMISGELPNGDSTLVIWRVLNGFANPESKLMHNMALDTFVKDHLKVNPREKEIDAIFVNGDNTLPNIKGNEEHWKVRLIEEEFQRLMFAEI